MAAPVPAKRQPLQAEPARRALHTVLAIAGWVVFVYWWWLVFRRVNPTEVRYTLWFIGFAVVLIVLVTSLWAIHNLRLFQRLGPRTKLRDVQEDFSRDVVGRRVDMPEVPEECFTAEIIVVRIVGDTKVYEAIASSGRPPAPTQLEIVS